MRALYFTQYFPPEVGATQTRADEMSRYLAAQGHHVTIVTEFPNHPSGVIPLSYRGRLSERRLENGVDVLRLWVWASPVKDFRSRMRFYLSYAGMATIAGALLRGDYDLVYATSPPLFTALAGALVAAVRRVPFVLEVRDLWPESAVALGELQSPRAITLAERLESWLYSRARRIVVVTDGIRQRLLGRGIAEPKVTLIANGANTDRFRPDPEGARVLRERLGLDGKFVALYAGIHGLAQGLETVMRAAHLLAAEPDIAFVFVGEGPRKPALQEMQASLGLRNVRLMPEVPAAEMPAYLSMAGCAIVPLRDEPVFHGALPSKMFEAWACARPVALSAAGEAVDVLQRARGGVTVPPEDPAALASAIRTLASDPEGADQMGRSGRAFVQAEYSRSEQARKLESLLAGITREGSRPW